MPFGLRNVASTFKRMMDKIFRELSYCVFVYQDDILVFSDNETSHFLDLSDVFKVLHENNLKVSIHKCLFNVEKLDFLGCKVSSSGINNTDLRKRNFNTFHTQLIPKVCGDSLVWLVSTENL